MAEYATIDLNDASVPELDALLVIFDRLSSFSQGGRVQVSAQRAKLVEAGRPKPKPGADPEKPAKPLPKPGGSRAEQARDEAAARAVGWAPSFGVALQAGEISMDHVVALSRVKNVRQVPVHESALLCQARIQTAEDFVKYLATWDAARDDEAGVDRTVGLRAKRKVSCYPDRDDPGLRNMFASLPFDDAAKVENTLRNIADELFHAGVNDGTTLQQRMADALVLMADRAAGNADGSSSSRPTVVVICGEESLRGRVEDAGLGYLLDGTPVPAAELRRIACDANILPSVMNGAGQVLDWGRTHRNANDIQRLALLTMYGGCIIDGCGCPTQLLEIHHLPAWEHGGRSDLETMAPLCKGDHTRGHAERWVFTRGPDGHIVITTPDGTIIPTRRPRTSHTSSDPPPTDRPADQARSDAPFGTPGPAVANHAPASLFDLAVSG
jgi:hypothetical protein